MAALVVVAGLSAGLALKKSTSTVIPSNASNASNTSTCLTRECVELGNQILSSLDQSIDPCDNFYKFACNRFLNRTIMPYGEFICFREGGGGGEQKFYLCGVDWEVAAVLNVPVWGLVAQPVVLY